MRFRWPWPKAPVASSEPVLFAFADARAAALAVIAFRKEAVDRESARPVDAAELRAMADRLQRHTFKVRPLIHRSERVPCPLSPSPGVSAVVAEYRGTE